MEAAAEGGWNGDHSSDREPLEGNVSYRALHDGVQFASSEASGRLEEKRNERQSI